MKRKSLSIILFSTLLVKNASSQNWSPVGLGVNNSASTFAVYNNELYAGGIFTTAGGTSAYHIARWNGSSWSAVGGELFGAGGSVNALAVYNNELYMGGNFTSQGGISCLAKWNGSFWSSVGSGVGGPVWALAVYNNELYATGEFITAGGISASGIAKWNGSSWSSLGSGTTGGYSLAVYQNELYLGGFFVTIAGIFSPRIAKWNGASWSTVGQNNPDDGVFALAVYNNELYLGGWFTSVGNNISSCNGSTYGLVGGGVNDGNGSVYALSVYNNELYVGGWFQTAGGVPANNIAKWNGTSWSAVGSGTNGEVMGLGVFNGELYAGGFFTVAGGISANHIARWSNCDAPPPPQPAAITGNTMVCIGSIQTYSVSLTAGATDYTWVLPSGWTGTSITNSITATVGANNGTIYGMISVIANNTCGNSLAQTFAVTINQTQIGPINGSNFVCKGSAQTYSISPISGATSYSWTLPSGWTGASTTNSITATVGASSGNISVMAINRCQISPSQNLPVTINPVPSQTGSITGNTAINIGQTFNYSISQVSNATGYTWSLGGGGNIISGQNTTSISINWLKPGNYTLSVNANNSCGNSNNQILNVTVIDPDNPFQIKVTPNPSPGNFYLKAKGIIDKEMHIEIFNLLGQKIYSDQQRAGTNDYSMLLNLEKVASGVYVVKIIIDEKVYLRTIVKIS